MPAYVTRMPQGIPGDVSRKDALTAEPRMIGATVPDAFGLFVKFDSTTESVLPPTTNAAPYGLLVRPYPTSSTATTLGTAAPTAGQLIDVMKRGYMTVKNRAGTAAAGGAVYVRYSAAATGQPLGGIEAAAVSGETAVVTGAIFMSAADADGNVEIAYNL